jgi:glycosyltransferase involved in cell wall biosynthesis
MRVIYVVSLFPRWSETFIVREINELIKLGVDVRIVSLKFPAEKLVQSDAASLLDRVLYPASAWVSTRRVLGQCIAHPVRELTTLLGMVRGLARHPTSLAKTLVVWWRTLALLPEIRTLEPDHLHAHWATYPSTAAMIASRRTGIPFSFTAHAHDIFLEDHLLADKLRHAQFGVTISRFNVSFLTPKVPPAAVPKLRVIHCGVSPERFTYSPKGRDAETVLAVGRLEEIKGFRYLVDACRLLAQRGVAFRCLIIGEGPLRAELQAQIDGAGLKESVRLLGARTQNDVQQALLSAAVFVLPSVVTRRGNRDGIPVALMEAMAVGLPVVSTRVSGIPELVEHGVSGLLAEPADAAQLAQCIETLLREGPTASRMAERARRTIEREFNVAIEARKLRDAFA